MYTHRVWNFSHNCIVIWICNENFSSMGEIYIPMNLIYSQVIPT